MDANTLDLDIQDTNAEVLNPTDEWFIDQVGEEWHIVPPHGTRVVARLESFAAALTVVGQFRRAVAEEAASAA